MIKAVVSQDGAHKLAQQKFLRPVDGGFLIKRLAEAFWILLSAALIIVLLSFTVFSGEVKLTFYFLCAMIVFWTMSFILAFRRRDANIKKTLAEGPDGFRREYTIDEKCVSVDISSEEEWGRGTLKYEGVSAALETDEFFIIGMDEHKIYSIRKNEITEGSAEELTALLTKKLGGRFRRKVK